MYPELPKVLVREVLSQDILPMDMDLLLMVLDLVVSAPELVFTKLVQFTSPDLLRVLASVVLMLSQDILVLAMGMVMVLVVSVQVLDCILLEQFISPGLPKVSVADTCTKLCVLGLCNCQNIFVLLFQKK